MLFVKKIEPSCSYCQRGKAVTPDTVLCKKKGVIPLAGACSAFRYDPLKRVPPRAGHTGFLPSGWEGLYLIRGRRPFAMKQTMTACCQYCNA